MTLIFSDFLILGFIVVSCLTGMLRGGILEGGNLLCWVLAFVITITVLPMLAPLTESLGGPSSIVTTVIGFVCFVLLLIVLRLVMGLALKFVDSESSGLISRAVGGVIGAGRGLLVVCMAYLAIMIVWTPSKLPPWVQNAESRPILQSLSEQLVELLPDVIAEIETAGLKDLTRDVLSIEQAQDAIESIARNASDSL